MPKPASSNLVRLRARLSGEGWQLGVSVVGQLAKSQQQRLGGQWLGPVAVRAQGQGRRLDGDARQRPLWATAAAAQAGGRAHFCWSWSAVFTRAWLYWMNSENRKAKALRPTCAQGESSAGQAAVPLHATRLSFAEQRHSAADAASGSP